MADLLVVMGIIGFVTAMVSVIFGVGRADDRQLTNSSADDRRSSLID
jgi:hypothetical protein